MPKKVLIAYDISSDRRRKRIANTLERFGFRVNKSVFICTISSKFQLNNLEEEFQPFIRHRDKILILPLCKRCYETAWVLEKGNVNKSRRKRRTKII